MKKYSVMDRSLKQKNLVDKWIGKGRKGTIVAATGFGKTRCAMIAIQELFGVGLSLKDVDYPVIVVVPLITLKDQWEKELKERKLDSGVKVLVINTAYKSNLSCGLLIIDEAHRLPATNFSKTLEVIQYKYILCLTATIERQDGREDIVTDVAPVIDTVSLEECLENGWISEFVVYNLEVLFTQEETKLYKKYENGFKYAASQVGGFGGDTFQTATKWLKTGNSNQKGIAGMYYNCMRKRGEICKNAEFKIAVSKKIINKFPDRMTLVFSQTIEFAEKLQKELGDISVIFHSKRGKKKNKEALKLFTDGRTKKRVVSSVASLNVGVDLPECSLGIVASGTSSKISGIQTTGRCVRKMEGKQAIIVNLYVPGTQEEVWTRKRTETQNPVWIKSLEEIT